MTTYNWYFSQAGHDAYGNGSIGNPWKSLSKAQNQINTANTEDVVNLFFKRGDTWRVNSSAIGTTGCYGIRVTTNHPKVNINAYNNGTLPIFDGEVTDFSSVPVHSLSGPTRWNRLFEFSRSGSIQNVHIQNVYGHGIYFPTGITNFTLNSTIINDFGRCGIIASYGASNFLIERNVIYNGEMLYLNGKQGTSGAWAGAIDIQCGDSPVDPYVNNKIRYNVVYDIYGEGINYMVGGSLVEYNIVGDTGSVAMFPQTRAHIESGTGITRYNYIIHSNTDNIAPTGEGSIGIRFMDNDFQNTGDNSNLHIEIYGNIIINRSNGIQVHLFASEAGNESTNLASLKIYNNTMIDCDASLVISQPDEVNVAYVYNNSSIHYNKTCPHVVNWDLGTGYGAWDISHNHFYPVDSVNTVLPIFNNNAIIADPKLTNAHQIDFTGQSGPTYFKDIKFSDLYPMADSPLIGSGKPLDESFDNIFLTQGTDFSTLPNVPKFSLAMQTEVGNWDLGAIISSGLDLCAGVVCDNICIGNDLWSQKCVSG
ncbi:MAG: right-handed parallel beta-helix repeat-containing protein, partial [Thermoplasmata archaeon]|nr:right-handed parallel beta-helix repeat-containing protein [Thermoplasmata archaeon]